MPPPVSDALVCFGATGDLAYKQIFPALQAMVRHGHMPGPVIGVAGRAWSSDQLRDHARHKSVETTNGYIKAATGFKASAAGKMGL